MFPPLATMIVITPREHFRAEPEVDEGIVADEHLFDHGPLLLLAGQTATKRSILLSAFGIFRGSLLRLRTIAEVLAHNTTIHPPRARVVAAFPLTRFPSHDSFDVRTT